MADIAPIVDLGTYFGVRNACRDFARTISDWDLHLMQREATRRGDDAEIRLFEAVIRMRRHL
jgi:hypothetical protein